MSVSHQARIVGLSSLMLVLALPLSGCAWLSGLRVDSVSDSVDYRANSGSVRALEIPPGLSRPNFDSTYQLERVVSADTAAIDLSKPTHAQTLMSADVQPVSSGSGVAAALTQLKDGNPALLVAANYEQAWAQTGAALQRMGLGINSQVYEQGIYVVSSASVEEDSGLFKRVFSFFRPSEQSQIYRLVIADQGEQSLMVVGDSNGDPLPPAQASAFLQSLRDSMSR